MSAAKPTGGINGSEVMGFAALNPSYGLRSQYDIALVEREKGGEITKRVRPADAA